MDFELPRFAVEKYCGRIYCGNGNIKTLDECYKFAFDGFCDKAKIYDNLDETEITVKVTKTKG